jgi:hypothetical protein
VSVGTIDNTLPEPGEPSPSPPQSANGDRACSWYWVAATYKAVHSKVARKRHLWQRIVFLIQAESEADAATIAGQVARDKEHDYLVEGGDTVRWTLKEVEEIRELFDRNIQQGTEVYWEFFTRVDRAVDATTPRKQHGRR